MSEPLGVTPEELRATSDHLADASERMSGVLSSLHGKLSGEGAAWGNDEIGSQFADGANGYLGQLDWVDGSVKAKTELLDGYSEGLKKAADSFQQQDQS
jgi:uncharacterized protein YukE